MSLDDSEAGWAPPFDERLSSFLRSFAACLWARSLAKLGDEVGDGGEGPAATKTATSAQKRALRNFVALHYPASAPEERAPHFAHRFLGAHKKSAVP